MGKPNKERNQRSAVPRGRGRGRGGFSVARAGGSGRQKALRSGPGSISSRSISTGSDLLTIRGGSSGGSSRIRAPLLESKDVSNDESNCPEESLSTEEGALEHLAPTVDS